MGAILLVLGLGAVVHSGVVVRAGVGCDGAIWGYGVHDLAGSTLSSCSWFGSFFFSGNGLKLSLEMDFGQWGGTI